MEYRTAMMMMATAMYQEVETPVGHTGIVSPGKRTGAMSDRQDAGSRRRQSDEQGSLLYNMQRNTQEVMQRLQDHAKENFSEQDINDLYMSLRSKTGGI